MSTTIVDIAKVTQAMDAGWHFELFKNPMGSYTVIASGNEAQMRMRKQLLDDDGDLVTDDFTPEQALTRAAYKCVDGKII